eukprot:g40039.t1
MARLRFLYGGARPIREAPPLTRLHTYLHDRQAEFSGQAICSSRPVAAVPTAQTAPRRYVQNANKPVEKDVPTPESLCVNSKGKGDSCDDIPTIESLWHPSAEPIGFFVSPIPGIGHPSRVDIVNELHKRPFERVRPPECISQICLHHLAKNDNFDQARVFQHVSTLCRHFGVAPPPAGAKHYRVEMPSFRMRMELHTEFSAITFYTSQLSSPGSPAPTPSTHPFAKTTLDLVPKLWLAGLQGNVLCALHIAFQGYKDIGQTTADVLPLFDGNHVVGSSVSEGKVHVHTDFRAYEDGFSRFLLTVQVPEKQSTSEMGRIVQQLLDVEAYRAMTLLSVKMARRSATTLTHMTHSLNGLLKDIPQIDSIADEQRVLGNLCNLTLRCEHLSAIVMQRLRASDSYSQIVADRLAFLREERLPALMRLGTFMQQRQAPALITIKSQAARMKELSDALQRTTALLRTRVEVGLAQQNISLLRSVDKRAGIQLRLQETVEGLSVVAISYYALGLTGYAAKSLEAFSLLPTGLTAEMVTGGVLPFVAAAVFVGVRTIRREMVKHL